MSNRKEAADKIRKCFREFRTEGLDAHFRYNYDKFETHDADVYLDAKLWKAFRLGDYDKVYLSFRMEQDFSRKIISSLDKHGIHYSWDGHLASAIILHG